MRLKNHKAVGHIQSKVLGRKLFQNEQQQTDITVGVAVRVSLKLRNNPTHQVGRGNRVTCPCGPPQLAETPRLETQLLSPLGFGPTFLPKHKVALIFILRTHGLGGKDDF